MLGGCDILAPEECLLEAFPAELYNFRIDTRVDARNGHMDPREAKARRGLPSCFQIRQWSVSSEHSCRHGHAVPTQLELHSACAAIARLATSPRSHALLAVIRSGGARSRSPRRRRPSSPSGWSTGRAARGCPATRRGTWTRMSTSGIGRARLSDEQRIAECIRAMDGCRCCCQGGHTHLFFTP